FKNIELLFSSSKRWLRGDIHKFSSPSLKGGNDVIKIWTGKFIPSRLSQIWQAEPERNTSLPYQFTLMAGQGVSEKDD
ncbi:hypothetical protein AHU44_23065, partial [Salmonella enterica subsp. diarizonae]|nr:hypothetical protein [Salmonella enterica subsp. diarizonae]